MWLGARSSISWSFNQASWGKTGTWNYAWIMPSGWKAIRACKRVAKCVKHSEVPIMRDRGHSCNNPQLTLSPPHAWGYVQDGCKVYMGSYMAPDESCFMVTWVIFINDMLEVGLTQNLETMGLRDLTTVELLHFIMCEYPTWIEMYWNSIWLRAQTHITSHYTWGAVTTLHDFGSVLGTAFGHFLFGFTISWSQLLARV